MSESFPQCPCTFPGKQSSPEMDRLTKIYTVLKRYLANCNIHGIGYIVEDNLHWTERLFWLITCAVCWFGCIFMVRGSLDGYYNRPVAFTAESTYLDWEVDFPSVSICPQGHPSSRKIAENWYKKKYGSKIQGWNWLFAYTLTKGNPRSVTQLSVLTSDNIVHIYKESMVNCTQVMSDCYWRSTKKFNCCDKFVQLKTAAGLCYAFNSRQTETGISSEFAMNQETGISSLTIGLKSSNFFGAQSTTLVSVDNNLAITTAVGNIDKEIVLSKNKVSTAYFTLEDTFNEPGLKSIPPERRSCRFPDERGNSHPYRLYSNGGCLIELQMENMIRLCGCVSHLFPYRAGSAVCNYTGLVCLLENDEAIMSRGDSRLCLPDCEGAVMRIYQSIQTIENYSSVFGVSQGIHLELLTLPTSRYRRYVVRSLLDLVVAVGSTAGLFMGAGILSLVEIPYWLLLRHRS